jgi:hypothetical protein
LWSVTLMMRPWECLAMARMCPAIGDDGAAVGRFVSQEATVVCMPRAGAWCCSTRRKILRCATLRMLPSECLVMAGTCPVIGDGGVAVGGFVSWEASTVCILRAGA